MHFIFSKTKLTVFSFSFFVLLNACNNPDTAQSNDVDSALIESRKHLPENALKGLEVAPGLEVQVVATEPMLKNPTNIDVDERGRIWVTEAYNYRPEINGNPTDPKGDRIIILEDLDGDGKADTTKVFYEGPEINAPLGVCVLGNRVLVSQSPYVWAFYDDDGDDKADRKEIFFQGIGGEQHDHGMHTFIFGPDGKLYFNFGNEGKTLRDKNNQVVLDQDGDEIGPKKYKQGMLFRCNPDGTNVECLGNNFRNNYELAVDSYGAIWQSDNDDDGNRGVRINYVMDYGNYGYTDEMTGAGWQARRTNMEDSIPYRHWHLNDPGVVPNLLQTGAGSPTGMVIYEGALLPAQFQNQMIHCDPGPNVVRSYPVQKKGAGYTAEIINILNGAKDQWFRPADVCVAPDGSLIVADWYDPGVGGHQAGDQQRGRIYRVAPKGSKYKTPKQDYNTVAGAITALQNPNLAIRHHAFTALQSMGEKAVPDLEKLWRSSADPRMRARGFWVLVKMPGGEKYLEEAIKESNPDLRMMGLRAARQLNYNVVGFVSQLVNDQDPQVRREAAIALRHNKAAEAAQLWVALAKQHDGNDRWYLEALGIGADLQWDRFFTAYLKNVNDPLQDAGSRDIVWRARTDEAVPFLATLASDQKVDLKSRLRYFRAFDFNAGPAKSKFLLNMIADNRSNDLELNKMVLQHLDPATVRQSELAKSALKNVLQAIADTTEYLELVKKHALKTESQKLLDLVILKPYERHGREAARLLLEFKEGATFRNIISGKDTIKTYSVLRALSGVGSKESIDILENVVLSNSYSKPVREKAAGLIGKSMSGEDRALELLKNKKVPETLIPFVVEGMNGAWRTAIYREAKTFLPNGGLSEQGKKAPTLNELLALNGNVENGKTVFTKTCSICHQINKTGVDFGPDLSEIGSKLAKDGLLEAIIHPSAGISFGFESWELNLKDGSKLTGIISSKTETDLEIKFPGGNSQKLKTSEVKSMKQLPESMMPAGLHETMTTQELADLVQYLSGLKKNQEKGVK